eukprot:9234135-Karenia_brevis.AAC.1
MMTFTRGQHENIDKTLVRFDLITHRASSLAGFEMSPPGLTWLLLSGLRVSPNKWAELLRPTMG